MFILQLYKLQDVKYISLFFYNVFTTCIINRAYKYLFDNVYPQNNNFIQLVADKLLN